MINFVPKNMNKMLKIIATIVMAAGAAVSSQALEVACTAGSLSSAISDCNITTLTVTGTVDARDFKFIADSLNRLTAVDMSGATIVACEQPAAGSAYASVQASEANALPATSFFGKKSLASVQLPAGVKSIGFAAFAGCEALRQVTIPATVDSIASYAFSSTGLTTVTVPATVVSMGQGVFSRCSALASATVATTALGDYTFLDCAALSKVVMGKNVDAIGNGAFAGCTALKSLTLPDGSALVRIGNEAFVLSGIEALDFSGMQHLESVGDWAFATTPVKTIKLPDAVTALGKGAFFYDTALTAANVPARATAVSDYAFAGDDEAAVGNVLKQGHTRIGDYAFYNVSTPVSITIPGSINYIGTKAMAGMTGLDTIKALPTTVPALGDSVWAGLDQNAVNLDIPDSLVAHDYAGAEQWREFHILKTYRQGDVNNDGRLDVTDVTTLINVMLGLPVQSFNSLVADFNNDGLYNVTDVTILINMILADDNSHVRRVKAVDEAAGNSTADKLYIDDFDIEPGQTRTVQVKLDGSQDYIALQCEITMPQGLHIVGGSIVNASLNENLSTPSRLLSDGSTTRVIAYSMTNSVIKPRNGAVLSLMVKADDDFASQGVVAIDGLVLVDRANVRFDGAGSTAMVGRTTGVGVVDASGFKVYAHDRVLVVESQVMASAQLAAINGTATNLLVEPGRNEYRDIAPGIYVVRLAGKSYKVAVR